MPYARKIYYDFFINIFHAELYFCDKFHVKCFQIMNNHGKFLMYFLTYDIMFSIHSQNLNLNLIRTRRNK
jgi:hypothetical protein